MDLIASSFWWQHWDSESKWQSWIWTQGLGDIKESNKAPSNIFPELLRKGSWKTQASTTWWSCRWWWWWWWWPLPFLEHLLCAPNDTRCFTEFLPMNIHCINVSWISLLWYNLFGSEAETKPSFLLLVMVSLSAFYTHRNWGTEKLSNLSEICIQCWDLRADLSASKVLSFPYKLDYTQKPFSFFFKTKQTQKTLYFLAIKDTYWL